MSNRPPNERQHVVATALLQNGSFGVAKAGRHEMHAATNGSLSPRGADQWSCDDAAIGATCAGALAGVTDWSLNAVAWISGDPIEADELSPQLADGVVSPPGRIASISTHPGAGPGVPQGSPHGRGGTGPPEALIGELRRPWIGGGPCPVE